MATEKFVSQSNLQHFWGNLSTMLDKKVDITKVASATELGLVKVDGVTISNTNGLIKVVYGNTANTAVEGNDPRLSNKRDPNAHTHGNITNDGKITATAATIAEGNKLVITDGNNKIQAALAFGTATNKYLTEAGTWKTIDTMTGASASSAGAVGLVPAPKAGDEAKVLTGNGKWTALPADTKLTTIAYEGAGNGVTAAAVSADGHTLTLTKGLTFLTEHPTIAQGNDTAKTAAPAFGGTVAVVTGVTLDANGHQTAKEVTTITIPSAVATATADGLMAKGDFSKLAAFQTADKYALKSDIVGMYRFKGTVATFAELPSDAAAGDVYNVTGEKGQNYAMTTEGTWDALGEVFSIEAMDNAEIDTIMGVASA